MTYNIVVDIKGGSNMKFPVTSLLLDACVLGALSKKPTYGYDLTQKVQMLIEVSESTLYPVLRRLQKEGMLESFDQPFDGRNRRYYKISEKGKKALEEYIIEWQKYKINIDIMLSGGNSDE